MSRTKEPSRLYALTEDKPGDFIRTYREAREKPQTIHLAIDMAQRYPPSNFYIHEFLCRCGCAAPDEIILSIIGLVRSALQPLREFYGVPVSINSGYRCKKHNSKVGGAIGSKHLEGIAADILVAGKKGLEIAHDIEELIRAGMMPEGGVGVYQDAPRMCHYDMRGKKARWRK